MPWQPGSKKRKPKNTIDLTKVLTLPESFQLMEYLRSKSDTVAGARLFLICDIMLNTGLRITELAALRIQDTPAVLGKSFLEIEGKGLKHRSIEIAEDLADKLERYIKTIRTKTLPRHVRRSDVTKPVFYSQRKRPYLRKAKNGEKVTASAGLYYIINKAAVRAALRKHLHPHMLRHSFATNALDRGIPPEELQYRMGHSDLTTTMKYLHFTRRENPGLTKQIHIGFGDRASKNGKF